MYNTAKFKFVSLFHNPSDIILFTPVNVFRKLRRILFHYRNLNTSIIHMNFVKKSKKWTSAYEKSSLIDLHSKQYRRSDVVTARENKDSKYFERRKRNNLAAKKSRDAKRRRENEMTLKLFLLEKENMLLKLRLSTIVKELLAIKNLSVVYNVNKFFNSVP
ncbi:protein giant-like [Daktulosphaira vitifoliae]|uniref:protein giant-like n=1 Tax=Daktulosphaira vitifoliae TaxID=58002 RepID=UPI0021AA00AA|nr:protein giant-like [Daktulosphaira vitifoliae]